MRHFLLLCLMSGSFCINAQNYGGTITFITADNGSPADWVMVYSDSGLMGYLNADGKEIVPPIYVTIDPFGEYHENWAKVQSENGRSGFINQDGQIVVEVKYDEIDKFGVYKENWAMVSIDGKYGFIDTAGREVVKPQYAEIPKKKQ
ncbi:WG repeat-containing protein [Flavobacterium sp. 3HN19-14]|uniref:WG repeat-containing protein n=1 Tax=Flavobacterium sp. 3HN19-14 TaxID=3448133 RepID=UPI003EDF8D80